MPMAAYRPPPMMIMEEVWKKNLDIEFKRIGILSHSSNASYIAIDTEFPGFLVPTPRDASPEVRYAIMKHNVEGLKPLQLGISFCDNSGRPLSLAWQINLCDFDPAVDPHGESPLTLVRRSGLDLSRNHREGAPAQLVRGLLWSKLLGGPSKGWITFHGLYDMGYLLKLLGFTSLPHTLQGFLSMIRNQLGHSYDLKYMAQFCGGDLRLTNEMGLMRISQILEVKLDGKAH